MLNEAQKLVNGFGQHLLEDGKSPKTAESYTGDVAGFSTYLQKVGVEVKACLKRFP